MIAFKWDELSLIPHSVSEAIRNGRHGLELQGLHEALVFEISLSWFLIRLHRLSGSWEVVSDSVEWPVGVGVSDRDAYAELAKVDSGFVLSYGNGGQEVVDHACGVFRLGYGDRTAMAVSFSTGPRHQTRRFVALAGAPRPELAAFYRDLAEAGRQRRMTLWGAAGVPRRLHGEPVSEDDVILPRELKRDLLSWLDRFWTVRQLAAAHHLPSRRGLLLVGTPGTGKTTLLRHLLTRYEHADVHVFIPTTNATSVESGFESMVRIAQNAGRDVIVILEDIDRLTESGAITPAGLLNHLDGLLSLEVPALWIATSNDPTTMDRSLLDRPGRFDRTIVLPLPGEAERDAMLRKYSRLELEQETAERALASSRGLSGAHLREACVSATLNALEGGTEYGVALLAELERVKREREAAREMHRVLSHQRAVGFAAE